jgi:peptidoglycan/LPS O-acetylase OafA/YrhL
VLPILVTLLFLGVLIAVASVSHRLIEQPGLEWARLAGWSSERSKTASSYSAR